MWHSQGLIFKPTGDIDWMQSHAQVPTPFLFEDCIRIYFATRDHSGKSQVAALDLDRNDPKKIINIYDKPILTRGKIGAFDQDGVMPSQVIKRDGKLYMYYSGWMQCTTSPYHNSIGLAVSDDNGLSFTCCYEGPLLDRCMFDPYVVVTPSILYANDKWHMWYGAGTQWLQVEEKTEPLYVIKSAYSEDSIHWHRTDQQCIKQHFPEEALANPCVIRDSDSYKMWFCARGSKDFRDGKNAYRLGYAESCDGEHWIRDDAKSEFSNARQAWDDKMQCYPYVIDVSDQRLLFYNGNGFGQMGFGYAIWE